MAQTSSPFDAGAGAAVTEATWQKMSRSWLATGVLTGQLNQLAVTADGSALSVSVATGQAQVEGFFYENDAALALTIATANATNPRTDTVVLRLDRTANTTLLAVVTGTPAASPVAPTLSATDTLFEFPLANVAVPAAAGVIVAGNVTDRRVLVKNLTEAAASAAYAPRLYNGVRVGLSAAQSVPSATAAAVGFSSEAWDVGGWHDNVTNNTRLTVPAGFTGYLSISGALHMEGTSGTFRDIALRRDGVNFAVFNYPPASFGRFGFAAEITVTPGQYIEMIVKHDAATALNVDLDTFLAAHFIGAS